MENKKMKLWKKILIIFIALVIILIIFVLRKYIIITNLINVSKEYESKTNYIVDVYSLQENGVTMIKSYRKADDYLSTYKYFNNNTEDREFIVYNKDNEKIGIIQSGETKIALLNGSVVGGETSVNTFNIFAEPITKLQLSIIAKIKSEKVNNKECYLLELSDDYRIWVEKETGIIIKEMQSNNTTNRKYTFDIVTDENIQKPDISDCKIQE